jgi:hypothetical protein
LVFGKQLHKKKGVNFIKHQKLLQKLIDTASWLISQYQSFLLEVYSSSFEIHSSRIHLIYPQSIEFIEVNDEIRTKCHESLKKALDELPNASHAILFVGTKQLASYSRPKVAELTSADIFLLLLYATATFNPVIRPLQERVIPVADYTNHNKTVSNEEEKDAAAPPGLNHI